MRRSMIIPVLAVLLIPLAVDGVAAAPPAGGPTPRFPEEISLPDGFLPEGIAASGTTFFAGSRVNGAIYRGDVRTGEGALLTQGKPGGVALGVELDASGRRLFVAGGPTGSVSVIDTRTGAELATYRVAVTPTFVNDVAVGRRHAWFTDSQRAVLYRIDLDGAGRPAEPGVFATIPLTGDWVQQQGFNANGIEVSPDGTMLLVANSSTGLLYRVDASTGVATQVDLGTESVVFADGLLLRGSTAYVVLNRANEIVSIELSSDWSSGVIVERLTDPGFDIPTAVTFAAGSLYAVNARFTTPPTPTTPYTVVKVG